MIKKIAWYLALGSTCAHPLSRRRGRFALKNENVEGNEGYEYDKKEFDNSPTRPA